MIEKRLAQMEFNGLDIENQWFYLLVLVRAQGIANQYASYAGANHVSLSTLLEASNLLELKGKTGDYPRYCQILHYALWRSVKYITVQPDTAWSLYARDARTVQTAYENGQLYT